MKMFAKIGILIVSVLVYANLKAQVCTPDESISISQGTFPEALPQAIIHEPYSSIIQFKAPLDTPASYLGRSVNVKIDLLQITNVIGMPSGFTYECNTPDCRVVGGGVGCAKITGNPTHDERGSYPLKVVVKVTGRIMLFIPIPIPEPLQYDTNFQYTLHVGYHTGISDQAAPILMMYPNPAKGEVNIELGKAIKENGIVSINDLSGREVLREKLSDYRQKIDVSSLNKGLYLMHITSVQGSFSSRLYID